MNSAEARLAAVRRQIAEALTAAGRPAGGVRLLAVSKAQPAAALRELYQLGQRHFGENYAQEMAAKAVELADLKDLKLEFIGALQSNKIALIVGVASGVQSVGSERHARLVARAAADRGKAPFPVHLIVNAGDEPQKQGLAWADVEPLARLISSSMPELDLRGIMAIPPPLAADAAPDVAPEHYLRLADLARSIGAGELSLGMSGDLGQAIAAGSSCVRVGTALFGERSPVRTTRPH